MFNFLNDLAKAVGSVVDKAFPFWVGQRTKIAVVACPVLSVATPFVPAPYQPVVGLVQTVLCAAAPALAVAGIVRNK